jgi:hypothetical protein
MTETRNPSDLFGKGIQLCFCGTDATSRLAEPLEAHSSGCLIWDWAMAERKITPAQRLVKYEDWARAFETKMKEGHAP